jgi:hypothetical protein
MDSGEHTIARAPAIVAQHPKQLPQGDYRRWPITAPGTLA